MPEWLIILVVFFVVSRIVRKERYGCGVRSRRLRHGHADALAKRETVRAVPRPRVESPMEALQRRYVEGSLTVEEYEAELDRLYRRS